MDPHPLNPPFRASAVIFFADDGER